MRVDLYQHSLIRGQLINYKVMLLSANIRNRRICLLSRQQQVSDACGK